MAGAVPGDIVGTLTRAPLNAGVDGAVATIIRAAAHVCEILDIGDVNGTATAAADMAVRKRGRTTELTHGTRHRDRLHDERRLRRRPWRGHAHEPDPHRQRRGAERLLREEGRFRLGGRRRGNNVVGPLLRRQRDRHGRGRQPDRGGACGARRVDVHRTSRSGRRSSRRSSSTTSGCSTRSSRQGDRGQGAAQGVYQGVEGVRVREVRPFENYDRGNETRGSGGRGGRPPVVGAPPRASAAGPPVVSLGRSAAGVHGDGRAGRATEAELRRLHDAAGRPGPQPGAGVAVPRACP